MSAEEARAHQQGALSERQLESLQAQQPLEFKFQVQHQLF